MRILVVPRQRQRLVYLRDLLAELVGRDMKLRYKRSLLGRLWSLLVPLAQLAVLSFVFRQVLSLKIPNYSAFLFTGLLAWSWFQSSLQTATTSITDNRDLIRHPGFPVAILPLVSVISQLIDFLMALPILLLFLLVSTRHLPVEIVALPLVIALQLVLTLGIGYLLAALHVTFRDTQYLLGVVLLLMFYLTPVFYDSGAIPARYQAIYRLNPLVDLIEAYRSLLLRGQWPDPLPLLELAALACVLLWGSLQIFSRQSDRFAEEL